MTGGAESPFGHETVECDPFPEGLSGGSTVLVAGTVDPASYAVGLRALRRFGRDDDTALVVTPTESAHRTIAVYERLPRRSEGPVLALVDTDSESQSVSALYDENPVVYVPSPGDLERIVVGLSDLTASRPPSGGTRHLLVRSLTPMLADASTDDVCAFLDRTAGLRTGSGLALFGVDYTAHDEGTMSALTEHVDGVLWVTERAEGALEFEFRPATGRF